MPNSVYKDKINRCRHILSHIVALTRHTYIDDYDEKDILNKMEILLYDYKKITERKD